jgi:hypothetical protein
MYEHLPGNMLTDPVAHRMRHQIGNNLADGFAPSANLAEFDPEGAAKLAKAFTMLAPKSWHSTDEEAAAIKKERMKNRLTMMYNPDPTAHDVMNVKTHNIVTKSQVMKALRASSGTKMILRPTMRHMYQDAFPGTRGKPIPQLPITRVSSSRMTPGEEARLLSMECGNGMNRPVTQE